MERRGSPHGLPESDTTQDWRISNNISSNWSTLTHKWKCGVHGVKNQTRPEKTPRAHHDFVRLHGTDRLCVCATTKTQQLLPNNGDRPRASAQNRKFPTKSSPVHMMHCREQSNKKTDRHRSTTIIPIPTDGPVGGLRTGHRTANYATLVHFVQDNK